MEKGPRTEGVTGVVRGYVLLLCRRGADRATIECLSVPNRCPVSCVGCGVEGARRKRRKRKGAAVTRRRGGRRSQAAAAAEKGEGCVY